MSFRRQRLHNFFNALLRFVHRPWYIAAVSLFACLDAFVYLIPTEALLIARVIARKKGWWLDALLVAIGSTLGALILAGLIEWQHAFIDKLGLAHLEKSKHWAEVTHIVTQHGAAGLGLISLSAIPQQPAVMFAALVKMSLVMISLAVFLGRFVKYFFFAWLAAYFPGWLKKIPFLRKHIQTLEENLEPSQSK